MKYLSIFIVLLVFCTQTVAERYLYGEELCADQEYLCHKVQRGDSWENLFPNMEKRDIVRRINRTNMRLRSGMIIAIPKQLHQLTIYDVAPFPRYIQAPGEKTIYISQTKLAWAAYNPDGELIWWGPISSGQDWCGDISDTCNTPAGSFRVIRKQAIECISTVFPRRRFGRDGGAPMPYCMHFFRGFALHGSHEVPGYRASHGCVRLFYEDAKWLNTQFIDLPGKGKTGTRVIISDT